MCAQRVCQRVLGAHLAYRIHLVHCVHHVHRVQREVTFRPRRGANVTELAFNSVWPPVNHLFLLIKVLIKIKRITSSLCGESFAIERTSLGLI